MALPQKVIEQLGREPPKTPGWSGQLLIFSSTVLFISLFVYFGLVYGYEPYLNSSAKKLQDQIQSFSQQITAVEQAELANFYSQLANLKLLLANHVFSSQIFAWLEKNTQANTYYDKFDLNITNNQLLLGGIGKTMEDVDQQLAVFESQPEVQGLSVSNISFVNSVWRFGATLQFKSGYFNRSPGQ